VQIITTVEVAVAAAAVAVVVSVAVEAVETLAFDVKNQAILPAIVLNQILVVVQINKVVMMNRERMETYCMNSLFNIKQCSYLKRYIIGFSQFCSFICCCFFSLFI